MESGGSVANPTVLGVSSPNERYPSPRTEPWYRTGPGLAIVAAYGLLTVGAVLASTGVLFDGTLIGQPSASVATGQVPANVYLYALLGGMAYAFASVVANFERGAAGVLRVGVRSLAALPLAAWVFLLADALGVDASGDQVVAGVAFLVGLYVNLTLRALVGLADRLFGRTSEGGSSGK